MGLTQEEIEALLNKKSSRSSRSASTPKTSTGKLHPIEAARKNEVARNERRGPLRYHDLPQKCASKGCANPNSYTSVDRVPYCSVHVARILNDIIVRMTDERLEVMHSGGKLVTYEVPEGAEQIGL